MSDVIIILRALILVLRGYVINAHLLVFILYLHAYKM